MAKSVYARALRVRVERRYRSESCQEHNMKIVEIEDFKKDMRRLFSDEPIYVVQRWWEFITKGMWREIKWFFQRGKRGYAEEDCWSLDNYLISWLPQAIRELKKNIHGHPISDEVKNTNDWKRILEKIARGFESKRKQENITWKKTKDFDSKYKELQKEFEEGMKLFTKYFQNLWD